MTIQTFALVRATCACCGIKHDVLLQHGGKMQHDQMQGCIELKKRGWHCYTRKVFTYNEPGGEEYNDKKIKKVTWVCKTCKSKADIIMNTKFMCKFDPRDNECVIQYCKGQDACYKCAHFNPFTLKCEDVRDTIPYIVSVVE